MKLSLPKPKKRVLFRKLTIATTGLPICDKLIVFRVKPDLL